MNEEVSIDKNSVIPVYYQLAKLLKEQILCGKLKPGQALPTEMDIANRYGISRMTVRRSISELVKAGMVYAEQGKGTFVAALKLNDMVFELDSFGQDIKKRGLRYKTTLMETRIVRANQQLKEIFQLSDNKTKFLYFRTLLSAEEERLAYETKYIIYTEGQPILETELQDPSLPNLIVGHSDYVPVSSKKVLNAAVSTEEDASILGVGVNAPLLVAEQTIYDPEFKIVGWGKSVYRGDRYKITSYDGWHKEK